MEHFNLSLRKAEERAFIKRAFGVALLCMVTLLALNIYLWKDTGKEADLQADKSLFKSTYEEDFSVDKLNSQVSVKQLRKALWNEDLPSTAPSIEKLSSSELEENIARLYKEIEQLEK